MGGENAAFIFAEKPIRLMGTWKGKQACGAVTSDQISPTRPVG